MNKEDTALLQARHLYNDSRITKVIDGGGFTVGKDTIVIEVNRLAWGYFETTLLKAMKNRRDLKERNPDLFTHEQECLECKGQGGFTLYPNTKEYKEAYEHMFMFDGKLDDDAPAFGTSIERFCKPCQGTGIILKKQPTENA